MVAFSQQATSPLVWNMRQVRDGSHIQMKAIATFLPKFWSSYEYFIIVKVKILMYLKRSSRSPNKY